MNRYLFYTTGRPRVVTVDSATGTEALARVERILKDYNLSLSDVSYHIVQTIATLPVKSVTDGEIWTLLTGE